MADAPRVLLIRRRYLGDVALLGSVLRNLRLHWPGARIDLLSQGAYAGVAALHPDANAALAFPVRWSEWPSFIRTLRAARYSHVLDFDNTERTALVTRITGAAVRATFNRELIVHRWSRLYTHAARVTNAFYDSHHITETYLALPAAIGVPVVTREVRLVPRESDLAAAVRLTGGPRTADPVRPRRILLHPGTRSEFRRWPSLNFASVCDRVQDELGAQVFLVCGPGEEKTADAIRSAAKTHLVTLKPLATPGALAALAAQCDAFLCHDSGPMHIAAGVGTPVVALFGSQNATLWRPLGERHQVLQTALPCACLGSAAPSPCTPADSYRSHCVRKVSAEDAFQALRRTLAS